jgi:hypothetical protein
MGDRLSPVFSEDDSFYTGHVAAYRKTKPIRSKRRINIDSAFVSADSVASAVVMAEILQGRGGRRTQWRR